MPLQVIRIADENILRGGVKQEFLHSAALNNKQIGGRSTFWTLDSRQFRCAVRTLVHCLAYVLALPDGME
jgi:hypothetical protein